jgi:GMP synthase PP-ATPase subunit
MGIRKETTALFTHGNFVEDVPEQVKVIATHETKEGETVISAIAVGSHIGVQFHPEVFDDTPQGYEIFGNFFAEVAQVEPNANFLERRLDDIVAKKRHEIRERAGEKHMIAFVSGGVDSVTALKLATSEVEDGKLHACYVDNGYMRDEDEEVIEMLRRAGHEVEIIHAEEIFEQAYADFEDMPELLRTAEGLSAQLQQLNPDTEVTALEKDQIIRLPDADGVMEEWRIKHVSDPDNASGMQSVLLNKRIGPLINTIHPQHKRRIVGDTFTMIQNQIIASLGLTQEEVVLLQGTNAADRIESGFSNGGGETAEIKQHHNMVKSVRDLNPLEPLDDLFKDEIRALAVHLGLPDEIAYRQPFPGPGTVIRILGLMEEGFDQRDKASTALINELVEGFNEDFGANLKSTLLPVRTVGVGGDERSHIQATALEGDVSAEALAFLAHELPTKFRETTNRVIYKLGGEDLDQLHPIPTKLTRDVRLTLRHADRITFEVMREMGVLRAIEQFPVVILPVGADGKRSIVLRPITTRTHMTVQAMLPDIHLPREFYDAITERILAEVPGISHVFLDVTNKPPGTTEWE